MKICTAETPFSTSQGELYQQVNGLSLRTPLGPTMANFYESNLEIEVLWQKPEIKPQVFCRYIDDTFIVCNSFGEIDLLKLELEAISPLKFTYELECNKIIASLDTLFPEQKLELV